MAAEQAVTCLALGIFCLWRAGMARLARLVRPEILHDLCVDFGNVRVCEILMTGLARAHRISCEVCGRVYIVSAMTVDTIGQVGLVLRLEVPRVMQFCRRMTLLTIAGNFSCEFAETIGRVWLMRVLIALLRPVAIGAKDRRGCMRPVHRIV